MTTATQVQLRRGTSTQVAAFTGAAGELTPDMTNKRLYLHDGVTVGGVPQASMSDLSSAIATVSVNANGYLQWLSCT